MYIHTVVLLLEGLVDRHVRHGRPRSYINYGRFPKFHRVFWGRDPGTLKSDIVSNKNIHN